MTAQRRTRLSDKLRRSRARIMDADLALGMLLMYLRFAAAPCVKTVTTDGDTIYIHPDFLDKLGESEVDYILLHQLLHILRGDLWNSSTTDLDCHHLSCDAALNDALTACGLIKPSYRRFGTLIHPSDVPTLQDLLPCISAEARRKYFPDECSGWSSEPLDTEKIDILIDLPALSRDTEWNESSAPHRGTDGDSGTNDGNPPAQNAHGRWLARLSEANEFTRGGSVGNDARMQALDLGTAAEPLLDWRTLLQDFLQETVCDYSFSPPDRRFDNADFFLPDFNETEYSVKDILFMVDSSGSIDSDQLACVYEEISAAVMQFNGKLEARLSFFDTTVTQPIPFKSISDVRSIIPRGGGGTDFRTVLTFVTSLQNRPSCLVLFTDGYGQFPPEAAADGIPVLWLINNTFITPPWGLHARTVR